MSSKSSKEAGSKHSTLKQSKSSRDLFEDDLSASVRGSPLGQTACIKCRKAPQRSGQLYCSDSCISLYAEDALKVMSKPGEPIKGDQRITVIEKKTGRIFASSNGPQASGLVKWLHMNPTFEVVQPSPLPNSKFYTVTGAGAPQPASTPPSHGPESSSKKLKIGKRVTSASGLRAQQAALEQQHNLEQSKVAAATAEIPSKVVSFEVF